MTTYTDHRVQTHHPTYDTNSRTYQVSARYEVRHMLGRTVIEGHGSRRTLGGEPLRIERWTYFRPENGVLMTPNQYGHMTRDEVASMLRRCRRSNLNQRVVGPHHGVMKQCPRTTADEWRKPH